MATNTLEPQTKTKAKEPSASLDAKRVVVYGHSQLLFWWPVWLYGFFLATYSYLYIPNGKSTDIYNTINLVYILILVSIITFTSLRLPTVFFIIAALLAAGLITLIKLKTDIIIISSIINNMHVSMNFEFHLVFNLYIFAIWLLSVVVYDRTEKWVIQSGKIEIHSLIDGFELIHPSAASFRRKRDDFVCHWILGLGHVGDVYAHVDNRTIHLRNVFVSSSKLGAMFRWGSSL